MSLSPASWSWIMRASNLGLAASVATGYLSPPGVLRYASCIAFPFLVVLYIESRRRARPDQDFQDTTWGM
jgi:hypothetical protein